MGQLAYLAPVGPFAGLSNAARHKIAKRYPSLSIPEIEKAAERFLLELQAPATEPRLAEARDELNGFSKELARFQSAVNNIRKYRLDDAIGEASRMTSGENALENIERSLTNIKRAIRETSRAIPVERAQLASRRLVATLAGHIDQTGPPLNGTAGDLLSLVEFLFDDLMVGGDASTAVKEWNKSSSNARSSDPVGVLIDLVVS